MKKLLIGIIIAAFIIRVFNLNYNSSFLDEAQYITIGLHILDGNLESGMNALSWVGGFPFFYPVLSAVFFSIWGIVGSRLFTVILGTFCVLLIYQYTKQLLFFKNAKSNETAGIIAALFIAITTTAITSSRLAIYDGLAFTLFFFGVVLFHTAIYSGEKRLYFLSSIVLFLSFLAKYIVVIFFPFLLVTPILIAVKMKKIYGLKGIIFFFCLPLILLTSIYIGSNFSDLKEFFVGQNVVEKASEGELVRLFWSYTGFSYFMFFLVAPFLWRTTKFLLVVLCFYSLIPLIIHLLTGNTASIQQHTFLSIIFILPAVGAGFAMLIQKKKKIGIMFTVIALIIQIIISIPQVKDAETFWPNLTAPAQSIKTNLKPSDKVLAEADDSMFLELKDSIPAEQVSGPFSFSYAAKEGSEAYINAINNNYFQYIELENSFFSSDETKAIEKAMDSKYKKIFDNGSVRIFKLSE